MITKRTKLAIIHLSKYVMDFLHIVLLDEDENQSLVRLMAFSLHHINAIDGRAGRPWMHERSGLYWEQDVAGYNNNQWIENFRMTKETFDELLSVVYDDMKPEDITVREPIPADKRTAIAVYQLASTAEYRTIANAFGVSKASVCICLKRFCIAINKQLKKFICWPTEEESRNIAFRIEHEHHFPQVTGCIDGTHIPVKAPINGKKDYTNRKGWESIILQAVVDDRYMFRDVYIEWPGSCHDASVFAQSGLFKNHDKLPKVPITLSDTSIPLLILGDPAYPQLPWLIKPYIGYGLSQEQESFNTYHSSVRIFVENAFGRLKGRWRILAKKMDISMEMVPQIVSACCALHNLCEERHIPIPELFEPTDSFPQPPTNPLPQVPGNASGGNDVREAITRHLANTQPLRRSLRFS